MQYMALDASPLLAASSSGLRPLARDVAQAFRTPTPQLVARALAVGNERCEIGRVHSGGDWSDDEVHHEIASALDPVPRQALRTRFEWYVCRGAFFHTDAHYSDVLFGVWYLSGPPVDIVFARAGLRISADPGTLAVFDPFEVHGVLRRDAAAYRADDYFNAETSVFAGFEVDLVEPVRERFGISGLSADARVVSSATRVSATTGQFE
jgi:hypothetical protein